MWMAYAEPSWEKAVDLESSIKRKRQCLEARAWDADHEAVYGMNRFFDEDYCNRLAKKYAVGAAICVEYLAGRISIDDLCKQFIHNDMKDELNDIRNFLVYELVLKYKLQHCNCNTDDNGEKSS